MAQTKNYHKTCPDCNGKPYKVVGYRTLWIIASPIIEYCKTCGGMGFIRAKKVVHHPDRFEPEVIF